MHSSLVRIQNVFGFFTTVAFVVAAFVAISVVIVPQDPIADVKVRSLQVVKGRPHYYSTKKEEYAHIKFDLDADFSSLFNWNTKQLFVWVEATYPSRPSKSPNPATLPPSRAVIWDTIIQSPSAANPISLFDFLGVPNPFAAAPSKSKLKSKSKSKTSKSKTKSGKLPTETPGVLKLSNVKPKYQITDISGRLAGKENVTLEVGWNVQPWVGALTWTQRNSYFKWAGLGATGGRSEAFALPEIKVKGGAAAKPSEKVGSGEVPAGGGAEPVVG